MFALANENYVAELGLPRNGSVRHPRRGAKPKFAGKDRARELYTPVT
jgi:hypothetical protein